MYQRKLVKQLISRLCEIRRCIQIIVGPRQTGKTTVINQALESIQAPIHYVSADDPTWTSQSWIRNEWEKGRLLSQGSSEGAVLVIDEIQKITQWSSVVKQLWDEDTRYKTSLKVVLSGSSTLLLQKGMFESLMGRFEVLYSTHWSYSECCEAFNYSFEDFLYFGGYPGAAEWRNDIERWQRYLSASIIEPTISQDILMMEEIRKPALMRALFYLGATHSAQELAYTKIQGQLADAGNTVTLAHYLGLLEHAGMLRGLEKFAFNKVRQRKSAPRFMVFDTSLMVLAADILPAQAIQDSVFRGHLIESAVGAYLISRSQEEGFKVYYWRDRNQEVDFVLQKGAAITALEVKSGRIRRTSGEQAFLKRYPQALFYLVGSQTCPIEDFLLGKIDLFKITEAAVDLTPVKADEIIDVFSEFINERAASGVLFAQVVSDISYKDRIVSITFDPVGKGIDITLFNSINPFSNLAEFAGTPIAFNDNIGIRLRSAIDGVRTVLADGTPLGTMTTEEIYSIGTVDEF